MSDESSRTDFSDSAPSFAADDAERPEDGPSLDDGSTLGSSASMAMMMATSWVRQHQTASMLGAFAVGVFFGSLSRN